MIVGQNCGSDIFNEKLIAKTLQEIFFNILIIIVGPYVLNLLHNLY